MIASGKTLWTEVTRTIREIEAHGCIVEAVHLERRVYDRIATNYATVETPGAAMAWEAGNGRSIAIYPMKEAV